MNEKTETESSLIQPSGGIVAGFPNTGAYTITKQEIFTFNK